MGWLMRMRKEKPKILTLYHSTKKIEELFDGLIQDIWVKSSFKFSRKGD